MKETKKFFDTNQLNKGYTKLSPSKQIAGSTAFGNNQYKHILPPMDVISQYEELSPGILDRIVDMAQKEQEHRHAIDTYYTEKYAKAAEMGRKSSLILIAIISLAVIILAFGGHYIVASILAISAFASIGLISYFYKPWGNKTSPKKYEVKYKNSNYKTRYKEK